MNPDNILDTIRKMIGGAILDNTDPSTTAQTKYFDIDLLIHINSAISILFQLGVGLDSQVEVDADTVWDDLIATDSYKFGMVKKYIYLKVVQGFDPPTSSFAVDSIEKQIKELEWRLMTAAETEY